MRPFISLCLPVSMKDSCPSGAFRVSHCLIYKVQTAQTSGALLYQARFRLSSVFQTSCEVWRLTVIHPARSNFYIISRRFALVNIFFELFLNFRLEFRSDVGPASSAQLIYQIHPLLSTLFSAFFRVFSNFSPSPTYGGASNT